MSSVQLNGQTCAVAGMTLVEVLAWRNVRRIRGVAIAVNDAVIPSSAWGETRLRDGDSVEIVTLIGGG
jgi:sulfur carrier protein